MKSTRRSLVISALALFVSFAMLLGTTFAWFTDSVTNTGNVIAAGNLKIDAAYYNVDMNNNNSTGYQLDGVNGGSKFYFSNTVNDLKADSCPPIIQEQTWEPGQSDAKLITVRNSGDLAANIRLDFSVTNDELQDALWFDFVQVNTQSGEVEGQFQRRDMSELRTLAQSVVFPVGSEQSISFLLIYGMKEDAGNIYQNKTFSANVTIMATQAPAEEDGFGNDQYDAAADGTPGNPDWATGGTSRVARPASGWAENTSVTVPGVAVTVPKNAIADASNELKLTVIEKEKQDPSVTVTVNAGQGAKYYDITLAGLKSDNTAPVQVSLQIGTGLKNVTVYHNNDVLSTAAYQEDTGVLTFETTSFSPFTIVYDKPWDGTVDLSGLEANTNEETKTVSISTPAQLAAFAQKVNSGTTYKGYTVTLTQNIDLGNQEWTPIGKSTGKRFEGTFTSEEGKNYVISNLKIAGNASQVGLFGACTSSTKLENFTLQNVNVQGNQNVGAVLGGSGGAEAKITNVHVIGNVKVSGSSYVGGILGKGYATVANCSVEGDGIDTSYVMNSYVYVGGIVGFMGEGNCVTSDCTVENLTVKGAFNGIGGVNGTLHFGNTIERCTVKNVVVWQFTDPSDDNTAKGRAFVGAFAGCYLDDGGKNIPTIRDCEFTGILYSGKNKEDVTSAERCAGEPWYDLESASVYVEGCSVTRMN